LPLFRPGIDAATCKSRGLAPSRRGRGQNTQNNLPFKKIISEPMISNVVISEVYAVTYVVLSKAEKHVP